MDIGSYKSNSNHYHHHAFRFHIRRFLFRNGQIQSEIADSMHNINIKMLGMSSHYVTIPPSSFAMPPPLAHSLDRLADTEAHANTTVPVCPAYSMPLCARTNWSPRASTRSFPPCRSVFVRSHWTLSFDDSFDDWHASNIRSEST